MSHCCHCRKCHKDAQKYCGASSGWHEADGDGQYVFSCLVRYLYVDEEEDPDGAIGELSDDCADQVEKALERRAAKVGLHPEVEDACREALIMRCGQHTGDGEEVQCLQVSHSVSWMRLFTTYRAQCKYFIFAPAF